MPTYRADDKQIFISYASEDAESAQRLYDELRLAPGVRPWLDRHDLLPGTRWDLEIQKAIKESVAVVVLLSSSSTTKRGFVQKEIRVALDVLAELPERSVFVIPVRLDACDVHFNALEGIHYADLFPDWDAGVRQLRKTMFSHLGIPEERWATRSPGRRPSSQATPSQLVEVSVMDDISGNAVAQDDTGVLIACPSGLLCGSDASGTIRRRAVTADTENLTAIATSEDGVIVVGTERGDVLRLTGWDAPVETVATLRGPIEDVHIRPDGVVFATNRTETVHAVAASGVTTPYTCDLRTFALAAGRTQHEVVVASAEPGDGAIFHLGPYGIRREETDLILARALARSPVEALYAIGHPYNGISLLDYRSLPPGDRACIIGAWRLSTKSIEIYAPIVGEAFDHLRHATNCVAVAFSPDGSIVAGGHEAGQVAVWSVESGIEIANARVGEVSDVAFLDPMRLFVLASSGLHVFDVSADAAKV